MNDSKSNHNDKEFRISQYFTYIGPFLIFLGMTRLMTFYNAFGVSITSYLDFSEVITSFFDILFIVVVFLAYSSIQNFLAGNKNQSDEINKKRRVILKEENFWRLCRLYINYFNTLLIFGLIVVIGFIFARYIFNWITTWTIFVGIAIFIFLIVFLIVAVEIERKHIQSQSTIGRQRFIHFALYFLVFTFGVSYYSSHQARLIKNDKSTLGVSVTLDNDQTLVSDSSNYFIGKTQNYLFIYHEKQRTADIIPMTRVKQITMPHKQINK